MKNKIIRTCMALLGIVIAGLSVGVIRHANFGIDPFQSFVTGVLLKTPLSFGTLYSIINALLLIGILFLDKHYIGISTIINLFLIGYIVEFGYSGMQVMLPEPVMWLRIVLLVVGFIVLCVGSSFYITADIGVSTYDAIALVMSDRKIAKFQYCRIFTDIICVIVGFLLGAKIGVGTVMTAFCMGPFIAFFRGKITDPLLVRFEVNKCY